MMDIGPGVKVRCVKVGKWGPGQTNGAAPINGGIYLVEEVYDDSAYDGDPAEPFLRLKGIWGGWAACQFRPVDPDIEALRALLQDIKDPDRLPSRVREIEKV
jgi:hypothetical protein